MTVDSDGYVPEGLSFRRIQNPEGAEEATLQELLRFAAEVMATPDRPRDRETLQAAWRRLLDVARSLDAQDLAVARLRDVESIGETARIWMLLGAEKEEDVDLAIEEEMGKLVTLMRLKVDFNEAFGAESNIPRDPLPPGDPDDDFDVPY